MLHLRRSGIRNVSRPGNKSEGERQNGQIDQIHNDDVSTAAVQQLHGPDTVQPQEEEQNDQNASNHVVIQGSGFFCRQIRGSRGIKDAVELLQILVSDRSGGLKDTNETSS